MHSPMNFQWKSVHTDERKKTEAFQTFSCYFKFIGARFATSDPTNLRSRPADHILKAFEEDRLCFKDKNKKLTAQKILQVFIGRLAFCARFIMHSIELLNSSYVSFSGAHTLQCVLDLSIVPAEMYNDVMEL